MGRELKQGQTQQGAPDGLLQIGTLERADLQRVLVCGTICLFYRISEIELFKIENLKIENI